MKFLLSWNVPKSKKTTPHSKASFSEERMAQTEYVVLKLVQFDLDWKWHVPYISWDQYVVEQCNDTMALLCRLGSNEA